MADSTKAGSVTVVSKMGPIGRLRTYFSDSIDELRKIHTPTRQETTKHTMVVVLIILVVSTCLFLVDMAFSWFMARLLA